MTKKRPPRKSLRTMLGAAVAAGALVLGTFLLPTTKAEAHHIEIPSGDGEQFVWPMPSWIASTDEYPSGSHHQGSADLSAKHFTPVYPARAGEVTYKTWTNTNGWQVRLKHETTDDSDYTYYTLYAHLAEEPLVDVGDTVELDTLLAYNGRTGSASNTGPHIHFVLARAEGDGDRELVKIPDIEMGQWAEDGAYIPGEYEGLEPIDAEQDRQFDVEVVEENVASVYETPDRGEDEIVTDLAQGEVLTVLDSDAGQYQIEVDGELGWIAHSAVDPEGFEIFDVEMSGYDNINVRSGPGNDYAPIGRVHEGDIVSAFEVSDSGSWYRIMWRCTTETNHSDDPADDDEELGGCPNRESGVSLKYGWVHHPSVANPTDSFVTRTRLDQLNVYQNRVEDDLNQPDCPCNSDTKIGELDVAPDHVTVLETYNGWYRVDYDGDIGWIRGWYTDGRQ